MTNQHSMRPELKSLCQKVEASMQTAYNINLTDQEYAMISVLADKKNVSVRKMLHDIIDCYFNSTGLFAHPAVSIAEVLRSEYRLRVLAVIIEFGETYIGNIMKRTNIARSSVKVQLAILEKMQLVESKRYGTRLLIWRLREDNPKVAVLKKVIEDWYPLLKDYIQKPAYAVY
jgi:DNA-binding transcriptional ArsR family regulator